MPQAGHLQLAPRSRQAESCWPVTCWWPTMPPPCRQPSGRSLARRPTDRAAARGPSLAGGGRRARVHRHRVRGRRPPHAHRAARCTAAAVPRRRAATGPAARDRGAHAGAPQAAWTYSFPARPTRSGPASRATAGRSSTHTSPRRWRCGPCGRAVAALPVAFEAPSAGFVLDWGLLHALRQRGVGFATLTHAAGISSTGDAALDGRLPFDEPYRLPASTVRAIAATRLSRRSRRRGGHHGDTRARACGFTPRRLATRRRRRRHSAHRRVDSTACGDALVSGTHEPGSSHYELLRSFVLRTGAGPRRCGAGGEVISPMSSAIRC